MKLTKSEADLFFDLMWKLQWYLNQKKQIVPSLKSPTVYAKCSREKKAKVRAYLFNNFHEIVNSFLQENPFNLDEQKLLIIQGWQQFVRGTFFIERLLKRYAIFINQNTKEVYGVLALYDSWVEMIPKRNLPVCVKAILLPFQGKIIYDGLLESYPIYFGSGIRSELKQIYLEAKQNGQIITDLEAKKNLIEPQKSASQKDWTPEINELINKAKKLRGGQGQPAIYSPIFSLIKLSLDLAEKAVSDSLDRDYYYQKLERVESLLRKIEDQVHYLDK